MPKKPRKRASPKQRDPTWRMRRALGHAAEILRGVGESIRVRNLDDGIEIELVGEITNMIKTAQTADLKGKAASEEAASLKNYRSSVKVVAGARSHFYRTTVKR